MFVLYATSSANSVAQKSSRKTITGPDVVNAMADMDFEKVIPMVLVGFININNLLFSVCEATGEQSCYLEKEPEG